MSTMDKMSVGRRRFLTYVVAAPTLTVAARLGLDTATADALPLNVSVPELDLAAALQPAVDIGAANLVLQVTEDNRVRFESPRAEVGQGITTALAMMIAEDLDVRLADIDMPLSDARSELGSAQSVGGSTSVRNMWDPVRGLAAEARARLVTAAAQRWNVPADRLWTLDTKVHAPDGRSATYGSLTADAAKVTSPAVSTAPKPVSKHRVIGTPTTQIDARDLVTGKTKFTLDVDVPGALPTVVARPPTLKGTVVSVDDSAARATPGVIAVAQIPTGVAVAAETFYQAMKARDALRITWGAAPVDSISDSKVNEKLTQAIPPFADPPLVSDYVDGTFEFAFVSHAPMETLNAVADVRVDRAELWCASKSPNSVKSAVATATGLPESAITVHMTRGGGSFGRRIYTDAQVEAALISQAIGKPVKLMWTRNDDMRHGRMRPASKHRIRITHAAGEVLSFENRSSAVQLDLGVSPFKDVIDPGYGGLPGIGAAFFSASQGTPYNFGVTTKTLNEVQLNFPTAAWRSVYSGHNRAAEEIMVDELAKKLGKDPLAYRLSVLSTPEGKAVIQKLASAAGWGKAMPSGWAQGIGYHEEYNGRIACLVEINATSPTAPRITKAVLVADVGRAVNPSGLEGQFMGSVIDGISTILQAGLHIDNGRVREGSYADFLWARQKHAPVKFETHFMPATDRLAGGGELAVPAAAAAVANAYRKATGRATWRFPINF